MKIAIFCDNFLPGVGGTENAVCSFAKELAKSDQVLLVVPNYHKQFDDSRFPFKVYRVKSIQVTKNDFCAVPFLDKKLRRILKEFKPNIVQTETLGPISKYGAKFAKKHKVSLVATIHTKYRYCYRRSTHLKLLSEMVLRFFVKNIKRADRIVTVSKNAEIELNSYGIKKPIEIIKNGGINRNNSFEKVRNDTFTCLFIGLIVKDKNLRFSLEALNRIKDKGKDFIFNIVGDGPDKKYFEKLVKKFGLQEHVKFFSRITDKEKIDKIYASSDLFLFPSIFDTDGLVAVEAGNMGTPSLVLENTGASERITNNVTGFTAKNNVEDYAERIIEIMQNKQLLEKVGENAKTLMTTWEDCVKSYIKIYNELLSIKEV